MVSENIKEAVRKCNPQKAIYALGEIVDSFQAGITNAQSTADQAIKNAEYATSIAEAAQKAAEEATQNAGEAFDTARASPNSSTIIMEYIRINGNEQNVALPVVNTTNAGILNANDYKFFQEYDARIRAVEGVSKIYLVELPSDNPSSQQITLAYTSQWPDAPNPPLEGTVVVDPDRNNLSYRWNTQSNTWYKISEVVINQFTNTTLGTIKGSTSDGEVQANSDGTGSVTGWDTVKANITTLQENAISNARAVPSPTGVNLELINQNNVTKNTLSIPISTNTNAGLMSPAMNIKLNAIASITTEGMYITYQNNVNFTIGPYTCYVAVTGGQTKLVLKANLTGHISIWGLYNMDGSESAAAIYGPQTTPNADIGLIVYNGAWHYNVKFFSSNRLYELDMTGSSQSVSGSFVATLSVYNGVRFTEINTATPSRGGDGPSA